MEIYTNSKAVHRTVLLDFPEVASSIDVDIYRDGELVYSVPTVTPVIGQGYSAIVPLHLVQHDGELQLKWQLTYTEAGVEHVIDRTSQVSVVTPILPPSEIKAMDPNVFDTDAEVFKIEKAVRHIIQSYTGQEFGHFHGTQRVKGDGGTALFLPRRLLELESVNGRAAAQNFTVDTDGYIVHYFPYGVPPVKADYFGLHMHVGGVIHNPNNVKLQNWEKRTHILKGRWGFEDVPAPVKEAAKLLINDYACADAQYRDRYLTSMTAADWRIQFHSGAFVRTGNVRADQLLSDFVVTRGWGVI